MTLPDQRTAVPVLALDRTRRIWHALLVLQSLIVVGGTAALMFGGDIPSPHIPPIDHFLCLFMNAAVPLTIGIMAKRNIDEADAKTAPLAAVLAITQPVSGLIAWMLTTALFIAFLRGWQPPIRVVFTNAFAFWGASLAVGLILSRMLFAAGMAINRARLEQDRRRRSLIS